MKQNLFINKVKSCIEKYCMISEGECVLVAVSGGADSIALLHSLQALKYDMGFTIAVAHLNHGIRGKEAAKDARFVSHQAEKLGVPCITKKVNVKKKSKKMKKSLQETGREVRYAFFFEEAKKVSAQKIAVAHTSNDQAETILMRLLRGAGTAGMCGIPAVRGKVIRPLIELPRAEIENFLMTQGISWVEDISNQKPNYLRNRVRSELLSTIQQGYNPNILGTLTTLADICTAEEDFFSSACEDRIKNMILDQGKNSLAIDAYKLEKEQRAIQRRVVRKCIEMLRGNTRSISFFHTESVIAMAQNKVSGKYLSLPDTLSVTYENKKLLFLYGVSKEEKDKRFDCQLTIPGKVVVEQIKMEFTLERCSVDCIDDIPDDKCIAFFDLEKVREVLRVRQRLPGDRFTPLGMKGKKKLKDFFIDEKVPRAERGTIPLIVSEEGHIIWVVGLRISEYGRIEKNTRDVLKISARPLPG